MNLASAVDLALNYAEALGCPRLHVMAGLATHGATREAYVDNLRMAASWAAPLGVDLLIEPINTKDMPDYYLTRTADARDVIAEVGAPNLGLQFDLYHRHVMEGGVEAAIAEFGHLARHYQCADPPDRGEPESGCGRLRAPLPRHRRDGLHGLDWLRSMKPRADTLSGLSWPAACGATLG